ncbi:hypothetical protein EIP86_002947 [Pleurotus ostreatoroseus]|nr:hypothetical protein EIP86_002947 [Pleurotus ostreatoroseus]
MAASADNSCDFLPSGSTHPSFAADDADIVLCSQDGVHFRTHTLVLRLGSAWFRTLFTLPQAASSPRPDSAPPPEPQTIQMPESAAVLADLLSMISGQPLPLARWTSPDALVPLLHAAEKYEMPGALSVLRLALAAPALLDAYPLRVYGLAWAHGWRPEARLASARTLALDLLSPAVLSGDARRLDAPALGALLLLHRRRRDALRGALDAPDFYANRVPGRCTHCQAPVAHAEWFRFKYGWVAAFESAPGGFASLEVLQSPEVRALLGASCSSPLCRKLLYHDEATVNKLRTILKEMAAMTVERQLSFATASGHPIAQQGSVACKPHVTPQRLPTNVLDIQHNQ